MFTGGLLPGAVLAVLLCFVVWRRYRGDDLNPINRATRQEIGRMFLVALPALALPFVIRAAVVAGVATATEVSTIGIVYAVVVGLIVYRQFEWRRLKAMLVDTACLSGAILLIIGTATGMAWGLTQSGFSRSLATAMSGLPGGQFSFMAVSIVAFIVLGSVLEGIPAIVLFGPLLFPIARAAGIHEVHYAMVVILAMGIGLFAPPFGVGYYAACAIGRVRSRGRRETHHRLHGRAAHRHGDCRGHTLDINWLSSLKRVVRPAPPRGRHNLPRSANLSQRRERRRRPKLVADGGDDWAVALALVPGLVPGGIVEERGPLGFAVRQKTPTG